MALEVTREMGEATLAAREQLMWEALNCPDLEVDMTAKLGKELRKLRRRNVAGIESRSKTASRLMHPLLDALHPEVVHALFEALMAARVERDLLMQAAAELLAANAAEEDEDEDEEDAYEDAALKLANLIEDIRERI